MKLLTTTIFLLIITSVYTQEKNNIADSYISQISGKLDLAKAAIDKDCVDPEKSKDSQTWYLKGYIYAEISKSEVYASLCSEPATESLKAIQKCKRLDTENKFYSECLNVLFELSTIFYDKGISAYNIGVKDKNTGKFSEALKYFDLFFDALETLGNDEKIIKHLLEYNDINPNSVIVYAGFASQSTGNIAKAKEYYLKLIDMESDVETARKKGLALAYIYYADLLLAEGKNNQAVEIVSRGIELYPNNQDLIISNINLFFQTDKIDELADILEIAVKNNPSELKLLSILAGTYNKISKQYVKRGYQETASKYRDKAIETYDKAIQLNPADKNIQFKLNYNCGLLSYNKGVKLYKMQDETNKEEWTSLFNSSLIYMLKAHDIKPEDKKIIKILQNIYQCLNQIDKAKEMEEKLY